MNWSNWAAFVLGAFASQSFTLLTAFNDRAIANRDIVFQYRIDACLNFMGYMDQVIWSGRDDWEAKMNLEYLPRLHFLGPDRLFRAAEKLNDDVAEVFERYVEKISPYWGQDGDGQPRERQDLTTAENNALSFIEADRTEEANLLLLEFLRMARTELMPLAWREKLFKRGVSRGPENVPSLRPPGLGGGP